MPSRDAFVVDMIVLRTLEGGKRWMDCSETPGEVIRKWERVHFIWRKWSSAAGEVFLGVMAGKVKLQNL